MSIDWKDVTKELPKYDGDILCYFEENYCGKISYFADVAIYSKKENVIYGKTGTEEYYKKDNFHEDYHDKDYIKRITYWAYINQPKEKDDK